MTAEHPDSNYVRKHLDMAQEIAQKQRAQELLGLERGPEVALSDRTVMPTTGQDLASNFPWLDELDPIASNFVEFLHHREKTYQGSWQKRGGVGAFMMLARKWDRIENIVREADAPWDIFAALLSNRGDVRDDVEDLVCYLLLVLAYVKWKLNQ